MTSPEILEGLARYLGERNRWRAGNVQRTLAALTERERQLVREVAVMSYVRGAMFGAAHGRAARVPGDSAVLVEVLDACLAMPDLYPVISSATNGAAGTTS